MAREELLHAEKISLQLFEAIEKSKLIVPGKREEQLCAEVCALAAEKFGIERHWHKKIVRSGRNTLCIYNDNPPDRVILPNDILFIDLGPIVDGWEADIGRTYITGNDTLKIQLKNDIEKAWYETQAWYQKQTSLKASDLFQYVVEKAATYGWAFGGVIAGHIVGSFPHEQPADPKSWELDVHPENHNDMFLPDQNGQKRNWILELHFIDKETRAGSYFEQLL